MKAAVDLSLEELGIDFSKEPISYEDAVAQPRIRQTVGVIKFWWDVEQVQAEVSRMHQHKDGRVTCELKVTTTAPGYPHHLHQSQINLVATRSKQELVKHLDSRRNDVDWQTVIEDLSREVLDRVRQGEPVVTISTEDEIKPPAYILDPLIPQNQPTVIYGLGGTGKSMLSLLIGLAIQLPKEPKGLGWKIDQRCGVMYLDWETSREEIAWRMKCLQQGMGLPMVEIEYRRCAMPLADDTEAIHRAILDKNIGFVIVDSVGAACGGDLNAAEPAIRMFTALRELNVTSLLVAHTSKNPSTKETSVYGSAFFNFYARSVWEMKKVQEAGSKWIKAGLYHKKANMSGLHKALGFHFEFGHNVTKVESTDIAKVSELAQHMSAEARICGAIKARGKATTKEIAEDLGITDNQIRARLNDLKNEEKVVKVGDHHWGLAYVE